MELPFGGPCGIENQIFQTVTRQFVVPVHAVMRELIDIGVPFVGDTLAVTVHVDATESGCLDTVLAQFPNTVESFVRTGERGGVIVEWIMDRPQGLSSNCEQKTKV